MKNSILLFKSKLPYFSKLILIMLLLCLFCEKKETDNSTKLLALLASNQTSSNSTVSYSCPTCIVSTLAGSGAKGSTDGTGTAASFNVPTGIAVDSNGIVYIADTWNHKIRKVTATGVVTTFAGSGSQGSNDGNWIAATFNIPSGVAVDRNGNVYVTDVDNHKIRKISSDGIVTTFAGSGVLGSLDGIGVSARFNRPYSLSIDSASNIFVADTSNHKIRKITSSGIVTTLAGSGSQGSVDGTGTLATFDNPSGITVDINGMVYTAEFYKHRIRKVNSDGKVIIFAGSGALGSQDGIGTSATFLYPFAVAADSEGNVYVADDQNCKIRKISSAGVVTTFAGSDTADFVDGKANVASFNRPSGLSVDSKGNVYVADTGNHRIRKITLQ